MESKSYLVSLAEQSLKGEVNNEDIKEKCYQLCRQFLAGVWLRVSVDQISVKVITGGLNSQLYYCAVHTNVELTDAEKEVPKEVVIRQYGAKHFNNEKVNDSFNNVIIALLVSENYLGPKVYGLFESGQMIRYYKHRNFRVEEMKSPKLVENLARLLARFHAMNVPIKRGTSDWVTDNFDRCYQIAQERYDINKLIEDCNCQTFKKYDIEEELTWLKSTIRSIDSPIAFTHVDFRGSNILVTEPDDRIVLCDFDYSTYGYRGIDLGSIFAEWNGRIWSDIKLQDFPEDKSIELFLIPYIDESIKLKGKGFSSDPRNSVQNLLKEVKIFTLVSNMFLVLIFLRTNKISINPNTPFNKLDSMILCEQTYKNYQHLKRFFIGQKFLENSTSLSC